MSRRSERIAEVIRREASLLMKHEVRDPRIGFVTITKATITDDLRNAVIYYSVLGEEGKKRLAHKGLQSALPFLKKEIGDRLGLRYTPEIRVKVDDAMEKVEKIEKLLKKIKEEKKDDAPKED